MPYIICDKDNYLTQKTGSLTFTENILEATVWKKYEKANNFLNAIKRGSKFGGYDLKIKTLDDNQVQISPSSLPLDEISLQIQGKVKEIIKFISQIEQRKTYLSEMLSETDRSIVDIEHAAEFYELNASQGYKIYKLLHDARVKRRQIKNEIEVIDLLLETKLKHSKLKEFEYKVIGLSHRKYTPRINKELFGV